MPEMTAGLKEASRDDSVPITAAVYGATRRSRLASANAQVLDDKTYF